MNRLWIFLRTILIALDQLAQTIIFGLAFAVGLGPKPRARDTISAHVGARAAAGARWAKVAAAAIDWIFECLGEEPGHCHREAIETGALVEEAG